MDADGKGHEMDARTERPLSLQARAAILRRAQSRKRTLNVNRTPNAPLAWEQTQGAAEATYEATEPYGYGGPDLGEMRKVPKPVARPSVRVSRFSPARRDEHGPILKGPDVKRYGVHYRTRLVGIERKSYVRTDAWARDRSIERGVLKVASLYPLAVDVRADSVSGVGPGGYAEVWTASDERPQWKDHGHSDLSRGGESPSADSLWAERWGVIDGLAYRFRFNRATGEWRKA